MNGYRFFLEYSNKKAKNAATRKNVGDHRGTVIAVIHEQCWIGRNDELMYDCFSAVQDNPTNDDLKYNLTLLVWGTFRYILLTKILFFRLNYIQRKSYCYIFASVL